jgi:hypothetical protein
LYAAHGRNSDLYAPRVASLAIGSDARAAG